MHEACSHYYAGALLPSAHLFIVVFSSLMSATLEASICLEMAQPRVLLRDGGATTNQSLISAHSVVTKSARAVYQLAKKKSNSASIGAEIIGEKLLGSCKI